MKDFSQVVNAASRFLLTNTNDMIFVKDSESTYVEASQAFVRMVGKNDASEIIGKKDIDIFADKKLAKRYLEDDKTLIANGNNLINYIEPITKEDGRPRYGSTSKYLLKDDEGKFIGILGITKDITKEYIMRQDRQQELRYLFEMPENVYATCYLDVDSWRIIEQLRQDIDNTTTHEVSTIEELCKSALESISPRFNVALEFFASFSKDYLKTIYASGRRQLNFEYQRKTTDGTWHWIKCKIRFMLDSDTGHLCMMLIAKNIDDIKLEEQELAKAAMTDKMTSLLNRDATMASIDDILARNAKQRHVLFMIDVDNFKNLNDTLGHKTGDEFLIEFASSIKDCFSESDVVGRIGGDEFFAFLKNANDLDAINKKARELLEAMNKVCEKYEMARVSGSVGISIYPIMGTTVDELYSKADIALYTAKRKGKNQFIIYSN